MAKIVKFDSEARTAMIKGVDTFTWIKFSII